MIELPEEKTPLDKFVDVDDDTKEQLSAFRNEKESIIKKLDQIFSSNIPKSLEKR